MREWRCAADSSGAGNAATWSESAPSADLAVLAVKIENNYDLMVRSIWWEGEGEAASTGGTDSRILFVSVGLNTDSAAVKWKT